MHARAYSIVCRREVQVSVSRMQYAMAMPSSWLRERCARRRRASTHVGAPAGKAIGRCPAGQADGFDLAEGEGSRRPVPAASRKASLAAKSAAALATVWAVRRAVPSSSARGRPSAACSAGPNTRRAKTAHGAQQALFHPRNAAQVAADSVDHEKPPERENSLRSFYSNFQKFLGKVCKFQLGILKSAFISCTMGYKFQ